MYAGICIRKKQQMEGAQLTHDILFHYTRYVRAFEQGYGECFGWIGRICPQIYHTFSYVCMDVRYVDGLCAKFDVHIKFCEGKRHYNGRQGLEKVQGKHSLIIIVYIMLLKLCCFYRVLGISLITCTQSV